MLTTSSREEPLIADLSEPEDSSYGADCRKPSLCDKEYDPITFDMLKVKPADFASQITLIDLPVFKAITFEELLSGAWCKKNKRALAPNIMNFTDRFNLVCIWCQKEILAFDRPSKRAEVMAHFVKISKRLVDLNNLYSTFAIVSALQSHSIHRLQRTWDCLGRHDRSTFEKIAALFDSDRNWEQLRKHLDSSKLPCIPYLGMYLTDLNFIEARRSEGNSPSNGCSKGLKADSVACKVKWFQHSSYDHLPYIECIQKYLRSLQYHEELLKFVEDEIYKKSLLCEPNRSPSSPGPDDRHSRKVATLSRIHLNPPEESRGKVRELFHTLTPKLQHSYIMEQPKPSQALAGHRKTRSLDAQSVLGVQNNAFSFDKIAVNTVSRRSSEAREALPSSVFYVGQEEDVAEEDNSAYTDEKTFWTEPMHSRKSSTATHLCDFTDSQSALCAAAERRKCSLHSGVYYPKKVEDENALPNWQGELRKIVVRTRGSKPAKLKCSRRCYLELDGCTLYQYERRALALGCKRDRDHYKKTVSKRMVIAEDEWKVIGPQGENDASFELHHPATGRIYRFLCESRAVALLWHSHLLEASRPRNVEEPITDLISFD